MNRRLLTFILTTLLSGAVLALDSLAVSPLQLHFSSDTSEVSQTFSIINTGNDSLTWTASGDSGSPWISVTPPGAIIGPGFSLVTVTIDRAALAPGLSAGLVNISGDGQDTTLTVAVEVAGLNLSTQILNFGSVDTLRSVSIANSGAGVLTWEAVANEPWIVVGPDSGVSRSSLLNVRVDRSLLPPGLAGGTVIITSNGGRDTIAVNVDVAGLSVFPASLDFGSIAEQKTISIANTGAGTLLWQAAGNQSWLTLSPASGSGDALATVRVNRSGLTAGVHLDTIRATSNGGNISIPVRLAVADLEVAPSSLSFGPQDSLQTLQISNAGSDTLQFSLFDDQTWLHLDITSGVVTTDTALALVRVNRDSVLPGAYQGNILIDSNGGRDTVTVFMAFAALILNPASLNFSSSADDTLRYFSIRNSGSGNLAWSISADSSWAIPFPVSGVTPGFQSDSVQVFIDRAQLGPGVHQALVTIDDQANNLSLILPITVEAAEMQVNPGQLTFSSNPADISRRIGISNTGAGVLNWQIVENIPWLSASPSDGATGGGLSDSVSLVVDRSLLPPGATSDTFQVVDLTNGGIIPVAINVLVSGLTLNRDSLYFGSNPADTLQTFEISNSGSGQLNWTAEGNQTWISVTPANDSTAGGETDTVQVHINRDLLPTGLSVGAVSVQDLTNNISHSLSITVNKTDLALSDTLIELGSSADISSGRFEIISTGSGTLQWRLEPDSSWLTVSPLQGVGSDTVEFSVDRSVLRPEFSPYSSRILVIDETNLDTQQVRIRVDVAALALSPAALQFRSDSAGASPDSFRIINSGSGELLWVSIPDTSWLVISPSTGSSDTTVQVTILENLLDPGFHQTLVRVEDLTNHTRDTVWVEVEKVGAVISESRLDFDSDIDTLSFVIENSGAGLLHWQILPIVLDTVWFELSPSEGSLAAGQAQTIGVGVHRERIREFRQYEYVLQIATDAGVFTVDLNMDVDQLAIVHDSGLLGGIITGTPATITATITDSGATEQATLLYRTGTDASFNEVAMSSADGLVYQAEIPGLAVSDAGVEYVIRAENRYRKISQTRNFSFPVRSVAGVTKAELQPAERYRLVSLPLNLDNKDARAVLQQSFGDYDPTEWRFFQLRQNGYADVDSSDILIRPGEAYWLIVRTPQNPLASGAGESILLDRPYQVPLHSGFNFIANPFTFEIPFRQVELTSGNSVQLYFWEDAWFLSDTSGVIQTGTQTIAELAPFRGFALPNTRFRVSSEGDTILVPDTLLIHPRALPQKQAGAPGKVAASPVKWQVQIQARSGELQDPHNYLRAGPHSRDEFDRADQPEPPVIRDFLSVYFAHPQWPRPLQKLAVDQRSVSDEGHLWPLEIRSSRPGIVTLSFAGLNQLPGNFRAWVVDGRTGEMFNLHEVEQLQVPYNDPKFAYPLSVIIGTETFVAGKIAELNLLPREYRLFQNYPNPFNPSTTIRFALPAPQRVRITIYNLLGQRVRQLVKDQALQAGFHARNWDGRSDAGTPVASGLYFYRIQAGEFVRSKKMLLIR